MSRKASRDGALRPSAPPAAKTVAEFFAGIGLMRLGLEAAGWTTLFANDIEEEKAAMYRRHFHANSAELVVEDIHNLSADEVPTVTLATASFPCNDLSLAGARAGLEGSQSSAFWGFIGILKEMRQRKPPMVLLENVTGFLSSKGGADFETALTALNGLGYSVDAIIVNAAHFVPQSRQRLFVIGRQGVSRKRAAASSEDFWESEIRPRALSRFIFEHPAIRWDVRPLPALPTLRRRLPDILEDLPDNNTAWWSEERVEYLVSQMSPRHRAVAETMSSRKAWSYGTIFRRVRKERSMAELRTDGVAGCLRTPRGGSGRQILLKAGHGRFMARLLSARECARLMGAEDFLIGASLNQALFGFGDAVCAKVIEWIATHYLNPLFEERASGEDQQPMRIMGRIGPM
jgi:DNA (cytosine-5)-methyltransferase 1